MNLYMKAGNHPGHSTEKSAEPCAMQSNVAESSSEREIVCMVCSKFEYNYNTSVNARKFKFKCHWLGRAKILGWSEPRWLHTDVALRLICLMA